MSEQHLTELANAEHDSAQTGTKKVQLYGWYSSSSQKVKVAVDANGQILTSGGGGIDPVGLKNVAETTINPATEDTLTTLLTETNFNTRWDAGVFQNTSPWVISNIDHSKDDIALIDQAGQELTFRMENENWNAADGGILMFGRDVESTPNKYRAFRLDGEGRLLSHIENSAHDAQLDFDTLDFDTGGGTDNVSIIGIALPASGGAVIGGTATNPLRTDPTGTTPQPVTGTFWQATQPVSGTFWQATQPVSLASVPSHNVTNAGTFAVQVNGAALTALQLIDNFISGSRGLVTEDNSAAIKTAVEIMDDWDESDRAKVNPIVGQAGVAAGMGNTGVTVQRVIEASSDAGAVTEVTVGSTTTAILTGSATRRGIIIVNDSDETIYLGFGASAVMGRGVRINAAGGSVAVSDYVGTVNGICASGGKDVTVQTFS